METRDSRQGSAAGTLAREQVPRPRQGYGEDLETPDCHRPGKGLVREQSDSQVTAGPLI